MQQASFTRLISAAAAAALLLTACGGGGSGPGVVVGGSSSGSGSSSGGSTAVLAGTFTTKGGSTNNGVQVFGAANSIGNGFFAEFGSTPAIYSFQPASSNGTLDGFFDAYAANGATLNGGGSLTLQQGDITDGTVTAQTNGSILATATFANSASGFSSPVSITLDNPQAKPVALSTSQGQYTASYSGGTAITSPGLSTNTTATYVVALDPNSPTFAMTFNGGCASSGTATPDATYNVYTLELSVAANCINNSSVLTLRGLAVYLKAGSTSPLTGSALGSDTLLVELDDSLSGGGSPTRAIALVAGRTAGP
jgi:hypothetical protein